MHHGSAHLLAAPAVRLIANTVCTTIGVRALMAVSWANTIHTLFGPSLETTKVRSVLANKIHPVLGPSLKSMRVRTDLEMCDLAMQRLLPFVRRLPAI